MAHPRAPLRRFLPRAGAALAVLASVAACRGPVLQLPPDAHPDLILLTLDTCRADKLGAYGGPAGVTPTLDRVAAEGVVFDDAVSPVPLTLPSHSSMLTGLLPYQHGVHLNGFYRLPDSANTIAEALHGDGYSTAAFVSSIILSRNQGLDQGFDEYDEPGRSAKQQERPATDTVSRARVFLRANANADHPVFVWMHLYDLHAPYKPPPPYFAQYARQPYLGELAALDAALLPFFEELRARPRPLVVLIAGDHGESLGEHGEAYHGYFVYQATQHVPLLLWAPGIVRRPERVAGPVGIERLYATLRELAGLSPDPAAAPSLLAAIAGRSEPDHPFILESDMGLAGYGAVPLRGLRQGNYKYVRAPTRELYDLAKDPGELHNLAAEQPQTVAGLDRELTERLSGGQAESEVASVDAATRAALESLGYTGGTPRMQPASQNLDVKQVIPLLDLQTEARHFYEQKRYRDALATLERILASCPSAHAALDLGGRIAVETRNFDLAAHYYANLTEQFPEESFGPYNLGLAELSRKRPAAAVTALELAVSRDPHRPSLRYGLGVAYLANGERAQAKEALEGYLSQLTPRERLREPEVKDAERLLREIASRR